MAPPQVAVVITCYDLGSTLGETLDSVLAQTLAAAEIVIVDDGSADGRTRQVLAAVERDGQRVVRTPNRGVGAARNLGVRLTSAPLIVLLDADDLLDPSYLERTAAVLERCSELDFVTTAVEAFGASNFTWSPASPELVESLVFGVPHISSMMRRTMWDAVGGYDEATRCNDELEFWTRVLEAGFRGELMGEPLLRYRVRPDSLYHEVIEPGRFSEHMTRFWDGHRATLERHGEEILLAKERFIVELRQHQQHVVHRQMTLGQQLDALHHELAEVVTEIDRLGGCRVDWGDLRRTTPLSPVAGRDRGLPIAIRYVREFLSAHGDVIRGRVLVVGGHRPDLGGPALGGETGRAEVVHLAHVEGIRDLAEASFDCAVSISALATAADPRAMIGNLLRVLAPSGVLLCAEPATCPIAVTGDGLATERRRFTETGLLELLAEHLPTDAFAVEGRGNVLASTAVLYGLADHELREDELAPHDPACPVLYCIRAVKPGAMGSLFLSTTHRQPAALILALHRVSTASHDPHHMCVTPSALHALLESLLRSHAIVPLADLTDALAAGELPDRALALTFDDGYADALSGAAPLLVELGLAATFFVTGQGLDGPAELWWDSLSRVLLGEHPLPPTLELEVGGSALHLDTATWDQRQRAHGALWDALVRLPAPSQHDAVAALLAWAGAVTGPIGDARPLTSDELRSLAALPGISIGAHTANHLWLPAHPEEVQHAELADHRARMEGLVGREVDLLCYPFGAHDTTTRRLARGAGFRAAVTTREAVVHPGSDPFSLPRLEVCGGELEGVVARVAGLLEHG